MHVPKAPLITIALVLAGSITTASPAQQPRHVELPAEPSCHGCTIELVKVARLGQPEDSILLDATSGSVGVTTQGEFLVPAAGNVRVAVYDRNGRFVRTFGRRGPGPGEFQFLHRIQVLPGDTVLVSDARNKVQLFGPNFEYVRSINVPDLGSVSGTTMPNGEVVTQRRADMLVVIRPDGSVSDSIPVIPVPQAKKCGACNSRWLAASSTHGRLWSTVSNRYQIQQIDREGTVHQTLTRSPAWFTPWDSVPEPRSARDPVEPLPSLYAIREDANGLLWSLASVVDPKWREAPRGGPVTVAHFNGDIDSMISVIDPRTGTVLAERRIPEGIGFAGRDLVFIMTQDQDGFVSIDIFRLALKRR